MKLIPLTQGKFSKVDDGDYDELSKHRWQLSSSGYAHRFITTAHRKRICMSMHRSVMGNPSNLEIDHINGDRLDNRRENLRVCTASQNSYNCFRRSDNKSGYKGVSWHSKSKKWRVQIKIDGVGKHLGLFDDAISAARFYDEKAKEMHGEFARTNFK